jgi:ATP-binding protein involved in chromosome partitioning
MVTKPLAKLPHAVQRGVQLLPKVKNIIAVASGKGGVGKSTTTVNLALALAAEGASVGILDADIYGPSQPMMMGIQGRPESPDGKTIEPMENHGVQVMSIGFLVEPDQAMIWRGPMATQALDQLLRQTNWRDLDYLLVDMPPGTGDIALTLSQRVPLTGAVIVTTPQDIALLDAKKGLKMFEKVGVPILGIVENMAVYCCPNCGHTEHIFGADGGRKMAAEYNVDYLGGLPLTMKIREQADCARYSRISRLTTCEGVTSCRAHSASKAFFLAGSTSTVSRAVLSSTGSRTLDFVIMQVTLNMRSIATGTSYFNG